MEIKVKLYGELAQYSPNRKDNFSVQLPMGASLKELVNLLKIPDHQVMLIIKNGLRAREEDFLKHGDEVILLPIVGGG